MAKACISAFYGEAAIRNHSPTAVAVFKVKILHNSLRSSPEGFHGLATFPKKRMLPYLALSVKKGELIILKR